MKMTQRHTAGKKLFRQKNQVKSGGETLEEALLVDKWNHFNRFL